MSAVSWQKLSNQRQWNKEATWTSANDIDWPLNDLLKNTLQTVSNGQNYLLSSEADYFKQ